ncbi:nitroreductase family deazaflavin-dependent oxidoreductase [Nocardia nepalensis]|uniref:nitroreductase family deazaflavin-dependent oxidoreductase n=1 Tax=Nocardia nepalensis TaxID=3375448 RepID=UPI003B6801A9
MITIAIVVAVAGAAAAVLAIVARTVYTAHQRPEPHRHRSPLRRPILAAVGQAIRLLLRSGIRLGPVMMLTVAGRRSGVPRSNPVDVFEHDGRRWLIATHTAEAAWVHNLRAAGRGSLTRGRRLVEFTAAEVPAATAATILESVAGPRLSKPIGGLVLRQTLGLDTESGPGDFARAAADHPVFELHTTADTRTASPARDRALPTLLIGTGVLVILAHALLGIANVFGTGQWLSGIVIGALIAGLGNHLRIFGTTSQHADTQSHH